MDDYKLAKVAANWWIEQMKHRCHLMHPKKVINNDSCLVIVDDDFARDISRFEEILTDEISRCIRQGSYLALTCCFVPGRELSKLTKKAQLSTEYLPLRAAMQICGNLVEVSLNGEDLRRLTVPAKYL